MQDDMRKDEEIMMEYKAGDINALEEIFQRYKKPMLNYAFKILNNYADAEDVVGEVFYVLTSEKNNYAPQAKFSTWLYTIAHNLCIDRIRRNKRTFSLWFKKNKDDKEYQEMDIPDTKFLPNVPLEEKDASFFVKRSIEKLPLEQKEAIVLREYHSLNYEDISKVLNCSVEKVKILIFRARERLRKELLPLMEEAK
jgi:RNA polymerase sigma-70 factor (ECF subfamily)